MKGLMGFSITEPTESDLSTLERIEITSDIPWKPREHVDDSHAIDFHGLAVSQATSNVTYGIDDIIPKEDLYFYDPSDKLVDPIGTPIVIPPFPPVDLKAKALATSTWHRTTYSSLDPEKLQPFLAYRPLDVVKKTIQNTTQLAKMIVHFPLRRHIKSRFKWANVTRIQETVSTDPLFSNVKSAYDGYIGAQVFYGCTSHNINVYGIHAKSEFHKVYRDFIREYGAPAVLCHDNAKRTLLKFKKLTEISSLRMNSMNHIILSRIL